jgi:glycosyltransferase involved in cell wall biosynthesis
MMLKVAKILTELKVDFEWNVAGSMPLRLRNIVERKEKARFTDCHINVLGFIGEEELCNLLLMSNLYIHTAYIENSPNSICEAQCAGIPIISTNVGGISSLIENGIDGILVPANDPWQMANAIIKFSKDTSLISKYSKKSKEKAMQRHNENKIKDQLISCYSQIIKTWSNARN